MQDNSFISSIRGKIIIVFLISLIALIGSYIVNKMAFGEIHESVENLANPNRKLIAVNSIFLEMNESEKSFRNLVTNDESFKSFIRHSQSMKSFTDSLRLLCRDNYHQVKLIDSISKFLDIREQVLLNYVEFRRALQNNDNIFKQTKLLDSIISIERAKVDSVVFINEQKSTTTKIDSIPVDREKEKKGFFRKLFGAAKNEPEKMQQIVQREINTQTDTIIHLKKDQISAEVQQIISDIEKEQNIRRKRFFNRETKLAAFENSFNSKITSLLSEVEKDIVHQTGLTNYQAEKSINRSSVRIYVIIAVFFLFAAVLFVLMLVDVTKSNKYRLLLEKAKEDAEFHSLSRQRFLSNMSHEIRTPLQSVIGYSEQIKKQQHPDKKYINAIQNSSEHLLNVINEILDYDSINSGKFTFEHKAFEMKETIEEVISILNFQASDKGIQLKYNDISINHLKGDAFRLKQILLNLIGNAIKFTDEGFVSLNVDKTTTDSKEIYTFVIQDTGIGIPFGMQEKIFEQFEQINLPFEQRYKGTGLGLSIVKGLVEGQGGNITVDSEPGKGAHFTFVIAYDKAMITDKNIQQHPFSKEYNGIVWLVDDDNLILQLCSDILTKHHIKHTSFHASEDLLNNTTAEIPSVILADIRMPGMNGIQLFNALRKKYGEAVKVIALTAQALPEERSEILAHGFDGILLKPFKEEDLIALFDISTAASNTQSDERTFYHLNTTTLEGMLAGDAEALKKILEQYKADTVQDIMLLEASLTHNKTEERSLLLHRLSGRTSQIGSKELGMQLRRLEIETHNHPELVESQKIESAIKQLYALLEEIDVKIGATASPSPL